MNLHLEREKIKDKSKEKEKPKENEFFENLKLEINEKISICTERETEISQILIELQDIVSGKDLPEDQEDFENKMKTIKEDDREEREDDLNELKESQNELKQMALSKKVRDQLKN